MNKVPMSVVLDTVTMDGNVGTAIVSAEWSQGRAVFGGLLAAIAVRAARTLVEESRQLRSMLVNYIGPVAVDADVNIEVERLREGKSASQLAVRLSQNGQILCAFQLCYGGKRESAVELSLPEVDEGTAPEDAFKFPYIDGMTPNFTRHVDFRVTRGQMPFSGSQDDKLCGWFQLEDCEGLSNEEYLVALGDAWPPTALQRMPKFGMASTLTWSFNIAEPAITVDPQGYWYFDSKLLSAANGYTQHVASVYAPNGELAATSHQSVAIFA